MARLNERQFGGGWGPEDAMRIAVNGTFKHNRMLNGKVSELPPVFNRGQAQLPLPASATRRAYAHEQTPDQFANDPRTWWHGRYTHPNDATSRHDAESRDGLPTSFGSVEGFHAGTRKSAEERLHFVGPGRDMDIGYSKYSSEKDPDKVSRQPRVPGRLYPLRATGNIKPPEEAKEDRGFHADLAARASGYHYLNDAEDMGHISVGVPKRGGYLSTHAEMVQRAQAKGVKVHPSIAWAAEHATAHTGEEYVHKSDQDKDVDEARGRQGTLFHTVHTGQEHYLNQQQFDELNHHMDTIGFKGNLGGPKPIKAASFSPATKKHAFIPYGE